MAENTEGCSVASQKQEGRFNHGDCGGMKDEESYEL
jgi:hypothetical protein